MEREDIEIVVARIDERLESMENKMSGLVTQDQFWPIKTLVYAGVGITLTAVVGWILVEVRQ
jgi:hypothetical protein